jgi:hypothetical protein
MVDFNLELSDGRSIWVTDTAYESLAVYSSEDKSPESLIVNWEDDPIIADAVNSYYDTLITRQVLIMQKLCSEDPKDRNEGKEMARTLWKDQSWKNSPSNND